MNPDGWVVRRVVAMRNRFCFESRRRANGVLAASRICRRKTRRDRKEQDEPERFLSDDGYWFHLGFDPRKQKTPQRLRRDAYCPAGSISFCSRCSWQRRPAASCRSLYLSSPVFAPLACARLSEIYRPYHLPLSSTVLSAGSKVSPRVLAASVA